MYLVYDTDTTLILCDGYKTQAAARGRLTVLVRKHPAYQGKHYEVAEESEFYSKIERKITKTNLMSGKEYEEGVNTPAHLSPACETYWSM